MLLFCTGWLRGGVGEGLREEEGAEEGLCEEEGVEEGGGVVMGVGVCVFDFLCFLDLAEEAGWGGEEEEGEEEEEEGVGGGSSERIRGVGGAEEGVFFLCDFLFSPVWLLALGRGREEGGGEEDL